MSLEQLEDYLNKTEAVLTYDRIRKEKVEIQSRLAEVMEELSKYKTLVTLVDGEEISLETLRKKTKEHTLSVCHEEIERKAQEKFEAEAHNLARAELERNLKLSDSEMPKVLNDLLEKKVNERVNRILSMPSLWPAWFWSLQKQQIDLGINTGLNETFWANVNAAANKARLDEWPKALEKYVREKITPFCQQAILSQIVRPTVFEKTCDKCGTRNIWELSPEHITDLIALPYVLWDCQNPQCRDLFTKHKITVTLGDLIMKIVGDPYPSEELARF